MLTRTLFLTTAATATLAITALGGSTATASTTTVRVGVADQNATMFASPAWSGLHMRRTRHFVKWNAIDDPQAIESIDAFVDAARAKGVSVLLHISTDDYRPRTASLPSIASYRRKVGALVARYYHRGVRDWGVWNEANDRTQPTYRSPYRAADYFKELWWLLDAPSRCGRNVSARCNVVALDVLDGRTTLQRTSTRSYIRRFYADPSATWNRRARIVGLHNYSDTNRRATDGTRNAITEVRKRRSGARIWLTETGGIVKLGTTGDFLCDPASPTSVAAAELRASRSLSWMFHIANLYRGSVDRLYVYQWTGSDCAASERFDAGLVHRDGSPRPGYGRVERTVRTSALFKP